MRILFLDLSLGISGDMAVAALSELADSALKNKVIKLISDLNLKGLELSFGRRLRGGLDCADFNVTLEHDNHDHDVNYLHCDLQKVHHHEHHHDHQSRNLYDVLKIIDASKASPGAKSLAGKIFKIIAEAEAAAHGKELDKVHFHEVGALDSIADILAFAILYTELEIDRTVISCIGEGCGKVRCQHGVLPVPVPAVVNILTAHKIPMNFSAIEGELITPTGAAIAAAIRTDDSLPAQSPLTPAASGFGAGKRDYAVPTMLRAILFELDEKRKVFDPQAAKADLSVIKIETNIDDATPENLGFLMENLIAKGALEVFFTPVYMKKMRPATLVTVLCREDNFKLIQKILLTQTTSIGLRFAKMDRLTLKRENLLIDTEYGPVKVKKVSFKGIADDEEDRIYPEYESVRELALSQGLSYQKALVLIYQAAGRTLRV